MHKATTAPQEVRARFNTLARRVGSARHADSQMDCALRYTQYPRTSTINIANLEIRSTFSNEEHRRLVGPGTHAGCVPCLRKGHPLFFQSKTREYTRQRSVGTHAAELYKTSPPSHGSFPLRSSSLSPKIEMTRPPSPFLLSPTTPTRNMNVREKKMHPAWPRSAIPVTSAPPGAHPLERTHAGPATCSVPEGPRSPHPWIVGTTPTWTMSQAGAWAIFGA